MAKAYTVTQISWQYNDETYYTTEDNAGEPVQAYTNKKAAEAEARRRNLAELRDIAPGDYGYELSEVLDVDQLEEFLAKVSKHGHLVDVPAVQTSPDELWNDHNAWLDLVDSLDEQQKGELYDLLNLEFYKVVEVELVA